MMVKARYKWRPLRRAYAKPASEALIGDWMKATGKSREEVIVLMAEEDQRTEIYKNDLYQVALHRLENNLVHLNIRRVDGGPILRDWRHFQQIKNELVGPECEGIELYPAESRLVDQTNKYHLYVVNDPTFRFPVGWGKRDVNYETGKTAGTRQRSL